MIGEVIPWSTSDHFYDSLSIRNDLSRVANIQGVSQDDVAYGFNDLAQNTTSSNIYAPFGNFYSVTYSLGLISNSGERTQKAIANSMLGFSAASEGDYRELFENGNIKVQAAKKYYVGNGTRGTNYIDKMTGSTVEFIKFNGTTNSNIVRLSFPDIGNDNMWSANTIFEHIEAEGSKEGSPLVINDGTFNSGVLHGRYRIYDAQTINSRPDIINQTNKLFAANKIKTIIGRFHTDEIGTKQDARSNVDYMSTAISRYGASRGRNLLKRDQSQALKDGNGYSNPYCRVWTYHHEYATLKDTMRPFTDVDTLADSEIMRYRRPQIVDGDKTWENGQARLEKFGARNKGNKLVKFAPVRNTDEEIKDQLKHLMFSIENLAWKGCTDDLPEDQKGQLGGRIMWFPPYNLEFNESTSVTWNEVEFIGRGEKIPTYINTSRGGNLSFDILIDHPSIVNTFSGKEMGGDGIGDVDDTESGEQTLLRFFAGCELIGKSQETAIQEEEIIENVDKPITIIETSTKKRVFSFFVFYPNNYSGVDDINRDSDSSFPLLYLLCGTGAGYGKNEKDAYVTNNLGTITLNLIDITGGNGYEMAPRKTNSVMNATGLSGDNNIKTPDDYNTLHGNSSISYISPKGIKWAYRVDKAYENQILDKYNYVDNASYGLNSKYGFDDVLSEQAYNIIDEKDSYFAFSEVFAVLENIEEKLDDKCDGNRTNRLKEILKVLQHTNNIEVVVSGYASKHGYSSSNKRLALNRKATIESWLKSKSLFRGATYTLGEAIEANFKVETSINDLNAKLGRAARVDVYCTIEEVSTLPTTPQDNITIKDNRTEQILRNAQNTYDNMASNLSDADLDSYNSKILNSIGDDNNLTNAIALRVSTNIEHEARKRYQDIMDKLSLGADREALNGYRNSQLNTRDSNGYKNEFKFFSELDKKDPFLHNKIMDKIKFFDPAFHSITPEGFHSRLTFLNQCTRQGDTSEWSAGGSIRSAANLAFGRPPILVLRIGDFYNTKIVITNMTVDFKNTSGLQWDLNDEGIGIMPMYAHITISFNFYGGSELGGPISRLQNAMSFNYYANTSVYDDKAEMVEYDSDGKISKFRSKSLNK